MTAAKSKKSQKSRSRISVPTRRHRPRKISSGGERGRDIRIFSQLVSGTPTSGIEAVRFIRDGYSVAVLKSASEFFQVPESRIQKIVDVPASTASRLEKKEAKIGAAATERIFRMSAVTRLATEIFRNQDDAIEWMCKPNQALGDVAPLDLMDTEPGAGSVRLVLNAIAVGGAI